MKNFELTPPEKPNAAPVALSPFDYQQKRKNVIAQILRSQIALSPLNKSTQENLFTIAEHVETSILGNLPLAITKLIVLEAAHLELKKFRTEPGGREYVRDLVAFAEKVPHFDDAGLSEVAIRDKAKGIAEQHEQNIREIRTAKNTPATLIRYLAQTHEYGKTLPLAILPSQVADNVKRLIEPKTWTRKIRRASAQAREMLLLKMRQVGEKTGQKYASRYNTKWHQQRKADTLEWAKTQLIYDQVGEPVMVADGSELRQKTLADCLRSDLARFSEMYTVFAGLDRYAESKGMTWSFVTATLPGEWHANPTNDTDAAWNERTPTEAKDVLLDDWQRIRAMLAKNDNEIMGLRVTEPQQDGTPHLHLLIFHHADDTERLDETLHLHWGRGQNTRPLKRDQRWNAPALQIVSKNSARGGAASYIMKYLAKGVSIEAETVTGSDGEDYQKLTHLPEVEAWRSIWNIRAFQFFGVKSSLQLWRALRRHKSRPNGMLAILWAYANGELELGDEEKGKVDFCAFLEQLEGYDPTKFFEEDEEGNRELVGWVDDLGELIMLRPNRLIISSEGADQVKTAISFEATVTVIPNGPRVGPSALPPPAGSPPADRGSPPPAGRYEVKYP